MSEEPVLECRNVGVRYGEVVALADISLAFAPGKIHAVVGQNGAGKTTFARLCAGIVRPTIGTVTASGLDITDGGVKQARAAAVELVHQSFALPLSFTVAEAMEFGSTRHAPPIFSRAGLTMRWADHLVQMGVNASPGMRIGDLPVETQQAVEIARALAGSARILILDEPTAVLSPPSTKLLFERIRRLRDAGITIILVLHKIHEVLDIADTVTVLRGGRHVVGPVASLEFDADRLAAAIVGPANETRTAGGKDATRAGEISCGVVAQPARERQAEVLAVEGLSTAGLAGDQALSEVSFSIGTGRIVGVAGVEGNGQRSLVGALAALVRLERGQIRLGGDDLTRSSLLERRARGLRIIPFERNIEGLSLGTSLWENWAVRQLLSGRLLDRVMPQRLRGACRGMLEEWSVRFRSVDQLAGSLSGGNAQKVILARELDDASTMIVAAQPTRGLDIAATAFVWQSLRAARRRGAGILLISSDLDELFDIADSIVVMLSGRIVGEFRPPYSIETIGKAMTGAGA